MSKERMPGRWQPILLGISVSVTIMIIVSLMGFSLYRQSMQLSDLFGTISAPVDEVYVFDYGDERCGTRLNDAGMEMARRTCLLSDWNWMGSGFLLRSDLLVTAYHVIEGSENLPIPIHCPCSENPHQTLVGFVVATAPEFDTAILQVQGALPSDAPPLSWSFAGMEPLTPLHIFGYEKDYEYDVVDVVGRHHATSYVTNTTITHRAMNETEVLAVSGQAVSGNSGGPVFTDSGEIVGMAIVLWYSRNVTLVVPAFTIHSVLVLNELLPPENISTE